MKHYFLAAALATGGLTIGSSDHCTLDEVCVRGTPTSHTCDLQTVNFAACLSAHSSEAVNRDGMKEATHVRVDADGTVHLLSENEQ